MEMTRGSGVDAASPQASVERKMSPRILKPEDWSMMMKRALVFLSALKAMTMTEMTEDEKTSNGRYRTAQ